MRSVQFDRMGWAAGIGLVLAMPFCAMAQQQPLRYQPTASPLQFNPLAMPVLPTLKPVAPDGKSTVVEGIVVRVNDKVITRTELVREQQQMMAEVQAGRMTQADANARQKDMLRDMIDEQLLLSRGKDLDINVDSDVIRQLDDMRKKSGLDSMEALEKAATDEGVSFEDYKAQIRNSLITQQVIREEVMRHLQQVSPEDMQAFYKAHEADFQQPEQIGLSEILIPTTATASEAEVAQAQAKADTVEAELKAGTSFEDEVKKYSGGPTAGQGGELGIYKRGVLGAAFDDPAFPLPVGGVTAPIRTRQGFVILKVTQKIPAGPQPYKDVEEQIYNNMMQAEMQPALRTYLTKLRENAFTDIADGYVDSGRSPNQSRMAFAAATPPPAPKVKKKPVTGQRFGGSTSPAASAGTVPSLPPASTNGNGPAPAAIATTSKKPKKIKREKVRYGQAPRNSLAPGEAETVAGPTGNAGPGAPSTLQPMPEVASVAPTDPDVNPLMPVAAEEKKTRFSKTEPYHGPKAAKKLTAKEKEKNLAQPVVQTSDEKQEQAVHAAALGVNGDTVKKKPKVKKVKGQPAPPAPAKERIQDRPASTGPQQPAPTVNPTLGAPIPGQASGSSAANPAPAK